MSEKMARAILALWRLSMLVISMKDVTLLHISLTGRLTGRMHPANLCKGYLIEERQRGRYAYRLDNQCLEQL